MPWYPGAIIKKVTRFNPGGSNASKRKKGRGVCNHVAVSEAASLFNYFNQPGNPCSHFYVRRDGTVEQYVDTDYVAPCNLDGNPTLLSIETQGGVNSPETEPWTSAQLNSQINLHIWLQGVDGFPIQLMTDSRPETKGIGWHELGIEPHVVSGGELWSSAYGKICPGNKKIEQIKTVIYPGVKEGGADMDLTEQNLDDIALRVWNFLIAGEQAKTLMMRLNPGPDAFDASVRESSWTKVTSSPVDGSDISVLQLLRLAYSEARAAANEPPVTIDYAELSTMISEQLAQDLVIPPVTQEQIESSLIAVFNKTGFVVNPA